MKGWLKSIPLIGPLASGIYHKCIQPPKPAPPPPPTPFTGSKDYWTERYETGRTSGTGSSGELAVFKAEVLNDFVRQNRVETVIEFGSGDGKQLRLARYPSYLGFDVSPKAVAMCREAFGDDDTKSFLLVEAYDNQTAELTLSLDVVYHLVEDEIFEDYMHRLFDASERFVIVYSSNTDDNEGFHEVPHVKHRAFTQWVETNKPGWRLIQHLPNRYPFQKENNSGSFADFFVFARD